MGREHKAEVARLKLWHVVASFLAAGGSRTGLVVDDGTTADGGTLADAGPDAPIAVQCTPGTVSLSRAAPAVMLVLDRSGSMGDALRRGTPGENRWQVL